MVGWTIQVSRDIHSNNILIIILWDVASNFLRPVRHILPIIPYLDNFWSSPRLGLISLNHGFGRSINSSLGSLWKNWDHGWVEKTTAYNIPMWCRHFLQQTICGGHPLKATWINIPTPISWFSLICCIFPEWCHNATMISTSCHIVIYSMPFHASISLSAGINLNVGIT